MPPKIKCPQCGQINAIPAITSVQATGYPVDQYTRQCTQCASPLVHITDFGRCDGIKKAKGFASKLAEQKATIKGQRQILRRVTEPMYRQLEKIPTWRGKAEKLEAETLREKIRETIRGFWGASR